MEETLSKMEQLAYMNAGQMALTAMFPILMNALFSDYTEEEALTFVDLMHHVNKDGVLMTGNYWPPEQIDYLWPDKEFDKSTSKWTQYVLVNLCWHMFGSYTDDYHKIIDTACGLLAAREMFSEEVQK